MTNDVYDLIYTKIKVSLKHIFDVLSFSVNTYSAVNSIDIE